MARVDVVAGSGAVVVVISGDVVVAEVVDAVLGEQATMRVITTAETQIGIRRMNPGYGGIASPRELDSIRYLHPAPG